MFEFIGTAPDVVAAAGLRGVSRDPKDDAILACAIAARARLILSGDRDLLVLHPDAGIDILTPRQFLTRYETA
jgi:predicted nucleic acid-binding protein